MKKVSKILAGIFSSIALLGVVLSVRNKKLEKKAEQDFPALGDFVDIQGCSLHYYSEGKGDVIVLLPDQKGDIYDFYLSPLWNKLKKNYKVVAFDMPGNGYSKRADWKDFGYRNQSEIMHQAIKELDLKNPLLVSHGSTAGVALSMLMEHQDSYKGALLLDDTIPEDFDKSDKLVTTPIIGKLLLWTVCPVIAEQKAKSKKESEGLHREYINKTKLVETRPSKLLVQTENKTFMSVEELNKIGSFHSKIDKPIVVIHGNTSSKSEKIINSIDFKDIFPKLKILTLENARSLISFTNSDDVISEIKKLK